MRSRKTAMSRFERQFRRAQKRDEEKRARKGHNAWWNYEMKANATVGSVVCGKVANPCWWCYGLEGQRILCVKVIYGGSTFFIDNYSRLGERKVFELQGGPDSGHASIPVDNPTTFRPEINLAERAAILAELLKHEAYQKHVADIAQRMGLIEKP